MAPPSVTSRCFVCDKAPYPKTTEPIWFICTDCFRRGIELGVHSEMVLLSNLIHREQKKAHG